MMPSVVPSVVPYESRATRHFPSDRPVLPEWTRHAWASMHERGWWMDLIGRATLAFNEIQKWSVADGVRPAAWMPVAPEQLPALASWAAKHGLVVFPRARIGGSSIYKSASCQAEPGRPWLYRVLLINAERARDIPPQLSDNDLGALLGYPACCRAFFDETWGAGQVDTTFDQFMGQPSEWQARSVHLPTSPDVMLDPAFGTANGPIEANMLWRWMGIRWVPHLPCSFMCADTFAFGKRMREVAIAHGYREEAKTIDEILNWPTTWSAKNGIAEIVGPCIKVSTRTDWHYKFRMFSRSGDYVAPVPELWSENGFVSAEAMHELHIPILAALQEHVPAGARVLDLGCGNGLLLKRLKIRRPDVRIAGVDRDAAPLKRAAAGLTGTWLHQSEQDTGWTSLHPDVALVSVVHLLDMPAEDRVVTLAALATVPILFPYAFDDCMSNHGPLDVMCEKAGLQSPTVIAANARLHVGFIKKS